MKKEEHIKLIFASIWTVTGYTTEDVVSRSRKRPLFYARMIAAHHIHKVVKSQVRTAKILGVDQPVVAYYLKLYRTSKSDVFREQAKEVEDLLTLLV